jgi:hypothetical protein
MPSHSFMEPGAFEPEAIAAMTEALDAACKVLHEAGRSDAPRHLAARRIITAAKFGERLPAMYPLRQFAVEGGLMSYSGDLKEISRRVGVQYIAPILKRSRPTSRCSRRPSSTSSSTAKPPRRSGSTFR